jgi:hypothetical protein
MRLAYRVVAGHHIGHTDTGSVDEFRQWARFEVECQENGRWMPAG